MIRSYAAILAAFAALSTVACASTPSGESAENNGGAAASAHTKGHREQVAACEAAEKKASETAASTVEMVGMEIEFAECLAKANDAAVPVIEKLLEVNESASVGGVKAGLTAAREASYKVCEELDKASGNYGGTLQRIENASCSAEREHFLAALIDDMVAFDGVEATYIPDARAAHGACYTAYDAAPQNSTMEMVGANAELTECVRKDIQALSDATAEMQIENNADEYGPIDAAKARMSATVDAQISGGISLCGAIAEAGENGIGTLTRVMAAACGTRVAENTWQTLKDNRGDL